MNILDLSSAVSTTSELLGTSAGKAVLLVSGIVITELAIQALAKIQKLPSEQTVDKWAAIGYLGSMTAIAFDVVKIGGVHPRSWFFVLSEPTTRMFVSLMIAVATSYIFALRPFVSNLAATPPALPVAPPVLPAAPLMPVLIPMPAIAPIPAPTLHTPLHGAPRTSHTD